MPIIRRRGKKLLYAGLAGAGLMGVLMAGGFYVVQNGNVKQFAQERQQYRQRIQDLEAAQLDRLRTMKTAWIPLKDLPAGHFLDRKDLQEVRLPADLSPDNMPLKLEQLTGKGTKIELRKGTPITLAMLYEEEATPPRSKKQGNEIRLVAEQPESEGYRGYTDPVPDRPGLYSSVQKSDR
ncbi:SAF domain-containing protein [Paenibacillus sp. DMB20]|uniref:SAF domain-containing protein n=1 Tax=Paenibacillus sp. DMB20 TaxID=1642570 RepID=UPI00069B46E1|nr:SAF domain-containing protein [Paenibacillus sp. DMB20]